MSALLAGIEAGGTKFVVAVGTGPEDIREAVRIPTTAPAETLAAVVAHLKECGRRHGEIEAIGVGTFGPAGVNPSAADYGCITTTPKPGWRNTDILGALRAAFRVPMGFDTDVNAAALGEWRWGAAQGCDAALYITVGTGIGGGFLLGGRPLHGLVHPEMGHIRLPRRMDDSFAGSCPWHGDCLEGLACGVAMEQRWQEKAQCLGPDHPAWDLEAHYLAVAAANFLCTLSPQRIVLGGGVMEHPGLLDRIRQKVPAFLNGYIQHPSVTGNPESLIVPPGLGSRCGLLGAFALAAAALQGN